MALDAERRLGAELPVTADAALARTVRRLATPLVHVPAFRFAATALRKEVLSVVIVVMVPI